MTEEMLKNFLRKYKEGQIPDEEAASALGKLFVEEMGFAAVDRPYAVPPDGLRERA